MKKTILLSQIILFGLFIMGCGREDSGQPHYSRQSPHCRHCCKDDPLAIELFVIVPIFKCRQKYLSELIIKSRRRNQPKTAINQLFLAKIL